MHGQNPPCICLQQIVALAKNMDFFQDFYNVFDTGFKYVLNVFALIAIYDGVRRILLKKYSKSVFVFIVIGLFYTLGSSGYYYFMANILTSLESPKENLQKHGSLPDDWGIELALADRVERTQNIARVYFKSFGKFSRVVNFEGNWQPFAPTEADIKSRDEAIAQEVELKMIIQRLNSSSLYWLISTLVAALLGWASAHPKISRELGFGS